MTDVILIAVIVAFFCFAALVVRLCGNVASDSSDDADAAKETEAADRGRPS